MTPELKSTESLTQEADAATIVPGGGPGALAMRDDLRALHAVVEGTARGTGRVSLWAVVGIGAVDAVVFGVGGSPLI